MQESRQGACAGECASVSLNVCWMHWNWAVEQYHKEAVRSAIDTGSGAAGVAALTALQRKQSLLQHAKHDSVTVLDIEAAERADKSDGASAAASVASPAHPLELARPSGSLVEHGVLSEGDFPKGSRHSRPAPKTVASAQADAGSGGNTINNVVHSKVTCDGLYMGCFLC